MTRYVVDDSTLVPDRVGDDVKSVDGKEERRNYEILHFVQDDRPGSA